jgi:chromosome segregation ATPase
LSTLGKILTVLIVVVSIAVAVLVAREFALSDNWHARFQEQVRLFDKALEQRDSAIQQRDEVKRTADLDKAVLQQQILTLTDELALRNNTNASLREQIENQEKRLQELAEQYAGIKDSFAKLMQERDGWRLERDDARKEANTLRQMYTELEGKWRVLLAQFADAKENQRQSDQGASGQDRVGDPAAQYHELASGSRPAAAQRETRRHRHGRESRGRDRPDQPRVG